MATTRPSPREVRYLCSHHRRPSGMRSGATASLWPSPLILLVSAGGTAVAAGHARRATCSTRSTTPRTPRPSSTAASGPTGRFPLGGRRRGLLAAPRDGQVRDRRRHPALRRPRLRLALPGGDRRPRAPRLPCTRWRDGSGCRRPGRSLALLPRRSRHARHRAVAHRHARRLRGGLDGALHPLRAALRPGRAAKRLARSLCGAAGGMALATKWSGGLALLAAAVLIVVAWWLGVAACERAQPVAGDADRGTRRGAGGPRPAARPARWWPTVAARRRVPRAAAARHLPAELHAVLPSRSQLEPLVGAAAADGDLQPAPEGVAHLRLARRHLDRRLPPRLVLLRRHARLYRGVIAIGNPFLWWAATSRSSRRPSSRSPASPHCCCPRPRS